MNNAERFLKLTKLSDESQATSAIESISWIILLNAPSIVLAWLSSTCGTTHVIVIKSVGVA
jgi:hypothetical protein